MANNIIEFPAQLTYWIVYNNDEAYYVYGNTDTNQVTECKQDIMEQFTQESNFLDRAEVKGIEIRLIPSINPETGDVEWQ